MNRYINILQRFRWGIALFIPLVVIFFSLSLKHLEIDGSYRIWFEEDSHTLTTYDAFRENFSNDDGVTIVFQDPDTIFQPKALASIQRLTQALWEMPHVDRVDSITNYQHIHSDPQRADEVLVEDFILEDANLSTLPMSYFKERQAIATSDSIIHNRFISSDGRTTMIFARLDPNANEDGDISAQVMGHLYAIINAESNSTGYKYWLNGGPPMTEAFVKIAGDDAMLFTPLVFLFAMGLLLLLFRRVGGALLPLGVVLFTFLLVLAIQTLLGYKLNNFTANIPIFIVAIGIADAVHIYAIWILSRHEGVENRVAVAESIKKNFKPILLTSLTTTVGFMTLAISKVVPVATLGIATSSGAMLAFVISIVWMPSVLLILDKPFKKRSLKASPKRGTSLIKGYGAFIVRNDRKIITLGTLIMILFGLGLGSIRIDSNTIRYFDEEVEIRKSAEFTMENLTGSMSYTLIVDTTW
jgi:predicted RND superfamily exporter protein